MRILKSALIAASLLVVGTMEVAPAAAQTVVTTTRTTTVHRDTRFGHRRRVCNTRYVHHRRVRRCFYR